MKKTDRQADSEAFNLAYKQMTADGIRLSFTANREYTLAKDKGGQRGPRPEPRLYPVWTQPAPGHRPLSPPPGPPNPIHGWVYDI